MKAKKLLDIIAALLLAVIGVIHLILMRGEYEEVAYMGILFGACFVGAIVAAVEIYRGSAWGWILGFFISAGSFVGYILSRTVGLPGMEIEAWLNPLGVASLAMEVLYFVTVVQNAPWKRVLVKA